MFCYCSLDFPKDDRRGWFRSQFMESPVLSNSNKTFSSIRNATADPTMITTVLFSIVIATGFPGNLLIVVAIIGRQKLRTPCYMLILSIAFADLGMTTVAAPQRIIEIYVGWPFGKFLCNFLVSIPELFVSVSVVAHTAIALERHRAIVSPFKSRMSLKTTKRTVAAIWVACYIFATLPQAFMLQLETGNDNKSYCYPVFPSLFVRRMYEVYLVVVFIAVPLFVQAWSYFCVFAVVRRELRLSRETRNNDQSLRHRNEKKIRLVKVLVLLVAVFQFCSIPRGVLMLIQEFAAWAVMPTAMVYADTISLFAYYIKHIINPVILWSTSSEFRLGCMQA